MGIPSVQKPVEMAGGRRGLMVPDWDHKEADPAFTEKAVAYIEERAKGFEDTPFFLYLAASAPHEPCTVACVPEFLRGASEAGPRGDMVALFDWMVGQVMDALDRCGVADDTLVIVTSDNGALPGCNGRTYGHKSCGDWRGFKGYIWEGGHQRAVYRALAGRCCAQFGLRCAGGVAGFYGDCGGYCRGDASRGCR